MEGARILWSILWIYVPFGIIAPNPPPREWKKGVTRGFFQIVCVHVRVLKDARMHTILQDIFLCVRVLVSSPAILSSWSTSISVDILAAVAQSMPPTADQIVTASGNRNTRRHARGRYTQTQTSAKNLTEHSYRYLSLVRSLESRFKKASYEMFFE